MTSILFFSANEKVCESSNQELYPTVIVIGNGNVVFRKLYVSLRHLERVT